MQLPIIALLVLGLVGCGGGGGGDGDRINGWVEITGPTSKDNHEIVIVNLAETSILLSGKTFTSTISHGGGCFSILPHIIPPICSEPSVESGVMISILNESNCYSESMFSTDGNWERPIRLTIGENRILVVAEDSSGNSGTDRVTITVPALPNVLPIRDIGDQALSVRNCGQEKYSSPRSLGISTNSSGDASVAWLDDHKIYAAIYKDGAGWSPTQMLSEEGVDIYSPPKVAMDMVGNALVIWYGNTSVDSSCNKFITFPQCAVSRYYEKGVGWSQPEIIPGAGGSNVALNSRLIMDQQGNGLHLWGDYGDFIAKYSPVTGWGQVMETTDKYVSPKNKPHFIPDNNGGAKAVWGQGKIFYSEFSWDNGWTNPVVLGDGGFINALGYLDSKPRIALSSNGNIVVAWTKQIEGDSQSQLMANYFSPGNGWSGQTSIENDNIGDADHASVGIDPAGNALVIWSQYDGSKYVVRTNHYIPGLGWGTDYAIGSDYLGNAVEPKLVMDNSGNATAVWMNFDGLTYSAVGSKYSAAMVWSGPELIELNRAEGSKDILVGAGKNGEAIVAWAQYLDIWETEDCCQPSWNAPWRTLIRAGVY